MNKRKRTSIAAKKEEGREKELTKEKFKTTRREIRKKRKEC